MGWAWRSSESYGDKDEPKKPETTSGGAKEPADSGSDSVNLWKEDESKFLSDDRGDWRGYQGATYDYDSYSYDRSIDDSDEKWYRKSSFRYGRYTDYSPSSLFRSAFYSSKTSYFTASSAENEAKNKAIRALRALSRNANTVCDKNSKIAYAVQYSSGADSNSLDDTLIDGKAVKMIYVSPDTVVEAKTTEDEDAAVDALTGFVLLRVQIAQEFSADVINDVNATTMRALPTRIINIMQKKSFTALNPAEIAAEHIDECLAGVLAKGMLTRLARRHVVKDWGGFAPYFVRHAKRFTLLREKLETAGLSVESIAGKLAYNMIDDEHAFEFPAELDEIAAKHLGTELEQEKILDACRALILEIRQYVRKNTPPEEKSAGPVESGLTDLLEKFSSAAAEALAEKKREEDAITNALTEFAAAMNEQFVDSFAENKDLNEMRSGTNEFAEELNKLYSNENFITGLRTMSKELKQTFENLSLARGDMHIQASAKVQADYQQMQVAAKMMHFEPMRAEMARRGATCEFNANNYTSKSYEESLTKVEQEFNDIEKIMESCQQVLRRDTLALRDKILQHMKENIEKREQHMKMAKATVEKLHEHRRAIDKVADTGAELDSVEDIRELMTRVADSAEKRTKNMEKRLDDIMSTVAGCRSPKTLRSEFTRFVRECENERYTQDLRADWNYPSSNHALQRFVSAAAREFSRQEETATETGASPAELAESINNDVWHDEAIKQFMRDMNSSDKQFESQAIRSVNEELFRQLEELFRDSDKVINVPLAGNQIGDAAYRKKAENMAESIGMTVNELLSTYHASNETTPSMLSAAGKEVGEKIRALMPLFDDVNPTDNQLFGEMIAVKTTILGDATKQVNDEARNDPEEDFVAYLSHSAARPKVRIVHPKVQTHHKNEAQASRLRQRNVISQIHDALQFQNGKRIGEVYGVRSGDLDEGGLHKLGYDCEHIWSQKTIAKLPDVAVGILVDQSGSMSGGTKIYEAREMCIALAEAIKKIPGIHLHIYGHTANMRGSSDLVLYEHYSSTSDTGTATADLSRLGTIEAHSNNYDGYAIKETAKLLAKDPAKRKYLFVIADGLPHGDGYAGEDAEKHVASVCKFVRDRMKIATYAFAVGVHGTQRNKFIGQYGKDHVMFLTTVHACLPQITRFLRNSLQKEKTLVDI